MLSSSTIVTRACNIAGAAGMTAIAGDFLNVILEDLKLNRDLKVNRTTQSITINSGTGYGPYLLEPDYLRSYDLFYAIAATGGGLNAQGQIIILTPITMEQMDAEIKNPQISNYPYEFATDMSSAAQTWTGGTPGNGTMTSAGQLFVYPATNGTVVLTHRYMQDQPDIATPATNNNIPWFRFSKYLITALAAQMMGVTRDTRKAEFEAEAEKLLQPFLIMSGDEQETVRNVRLDPRHFRASRGLKPTKTMPF